MAFTVTELSFDVYDTHNVKTLGIVDTSVYDSNASGFTLQVIIPGYEPIDAVELNYYKNGVTILNSNNLKLTNVTSPNLYTNLPDGLWTAKISVCPHESNWFEKSWYRTNELLCKYYKAFLNLELNICTDCYNKHKKQKLDLIWTYIQGIHANVSDSNFKAATDLYSTANKMLDKLLNCQDCNDTH